MAYSKSFEYKNEILNTGQFAYGIKNLIEILLEYSEVPQISRKNKMPDGINVERSDLTYQDLDDVCDLSKEVIQISFTHKKNGWYYFNFDFFMESIHLHVSCESSLLLNQIDEIVKSILSRNFSKTAFDKKISSMININVGNKNQREEKTYQSDSSTDNFDNSKYKSGNSRNNLFWIILGIIGGLGALAGILGYLKIGP